MNRKNISFLSGRALMEAGSLCYLNKEYAEFKMLQSSADQLFLQVNGFLLLSIYLCICLIDVCKMLLSAKHYESCQHQRDPSVLYPVRCRSRGRVQRVHTPPEMKPPSSYLLLKFVYLTGQ